MSRPASQGSRLRQLPRSQRLSTLLRPSTGSTTGSTNGVARLLRQTYPTGTELAGTPLQAATHGEAVPQLGRRVPRSAAPLATEISPPRENAYAGDPGDTTATATLLILVGLLRLFFLSFPLLHLIEDTV